MATRSVGRELREELEARTVSRATMVRARKTLDWEGGVVVGDLGNDEVVVAKRSVARHSSTDKSDICPCGK
jgi:hypothetical protein